MNSERATIATQDATMHSVKGLMWTFKNDREVTTFEVKGDNKLFLQDVAYDGRFVHVLNSTDSYILVVFKLSDAEECPRYHKCDFV